MNVQLFPERCISCGICQLKAPLVFDCEDTGIVKFVNVENPLAVFQGSKQQSVHFENFLDAVKRCPTHAIKFDQGQT